LRNSLAQSQPSNDPLRRSNKKPITAYRYNHFDPPMLISMQERQDEDCMSETVLNRVTEKVRPTSPQVDYPAITQKRSLLWV
jgi:hypothetical protein